MYWLSTGGNIVELNVFQDPPHRDWYNSWHSLLMHGRLLVSWNKKIYFQHLTMFLDLFEISLLEKIEIPRWIFKRKTKQDKNVLPDGLNWLAGTKYYLYQILFVSNRYEKHGQMLKIFFSDILWHHKPTV